MRNSHSSIMKKIILICAAILWSTGCVVVIGSNHNKIKSDPDTHTKVTNENKG